MTTKKTTAKKSTANLFNPYAGMWLLGSKHPLMVTHRTSKSVTLKYGGVSLGKHFGEMHEHKPS